MSDLKVVAKGNMSVVLFDQNNNKAYKCIPHSSTSCKPSYCGHLKKEYETLKRMGPHPSIVNVYDFNTLKPFLRKEIPQKYMISPDFDDIQQQQQYQKQQQKKQQHNIYDDITEFIKNFQGYDTDPTICVMELEQMHCDYLDFLLVNPPVLSKLSIFKDVIEGVYHLHTVQNIAHNDLRLPNILLKKIQQSSSKILENLKNSTEGKQKSPPISNNSNNSQPSYWTEYFEKQKMVQNNPHALNCEGEEFMQLEGVLADFGFAGYNSKIFKNLTDTHLSPDAQLYQKTYNQYLQQQPPRQQHQNNILEDLPEIDHFKNDVFQLGVSMFQAFFSGLLPFENPRVLRSNDKIYKKMYRENKDDFWRNVNFHRQSKKIQTETSKDFVKSLKHLLQNMLEPSQNNRFSISQVRQHPIFSCLNNQQQKC